MKRAIPFSVILALTPALIGLAACADSGSNSARRPRTSLGSTTSSTEPIDLTRVALRAVRGSTTSTVPSSPGAASISGRVRDSSGRALAGATIIATWYATDPPVQHNVMSGLDGSYSFTTIHGGRWRVRAYRFPEWATPKSVAFFLAADEEQDLDLVVDLLTDFEVKATINPDPPTVGDEASLVIRVGRRSLDPDGKIRSDPAGGVSVTILSPSSWSIDISDSTRTTGFDGTVRWSVSCQSEGVQPLELRVAGKTVTPTLPACAPAVAPVTTSTIPATSTTG